MLTSPRGERLRDLCAAAGIDGVLSPDMLVPLWEKFIVLVPLANVNALTRAAAGQIPRRPRHLERSSRRACARPWRSGRAEGVALPSDAAERGAGDDPLDAGPSHDLDGQRPAARQPA